MDVRFLSKIFSSFFKKNCHFHLLTRSFSKKPVLQPAYSGVNQPYCASSFVSLAGPFNFGKTFPKAAAKLHSFDPWQHF